MYPGNKGAWPKLKGNKSTSGNRDQVKSCLSIRFKIIGIRRFSQGNKGTYNLTPLNDPQRKSCSSAFISLNAWMDNGANTVDSFYSFHTDFQKVQRVHLVSRWVVIRYHFACFSNHCLLLSLHDRRVRKAP